MNDPLKVSTSLDEIANTTMRLNELKMRIMAINKLCGETPFDLESKIAQDLRQVQRTIKYQISDLARFYDGEEKRQLSTAIAEFIKIEDDLIDRLGDQIALI